ncbi:PaaI family thioesterase [Streptomyces sp. ME02-8801-2C]|uniref:PaaI family thioesterase n=1 Tax=Streptomyces sp. ME02-8801-2C TaxID=3028680 RepID=UPI0029ACD7E8|nr:PaaI family thioesterase [Streptomyces sp. ME02-8801-2C]MDX3457115.1 PaaI family thioesterase [Streptomyces sp. ME02-8801-2C]
MPGFDVFRSAFVEAVGLRFTEVAEKRVRGEMLLGAEHHTPWGVVHGGVYTAAVESAATVGASAAVADRDQVAVGVANSTDFIRPITAGTVQVLAEAIQQGRSQQLWQVAVTSADTGKLIAHGQLRLANVPAAELPNTLRQHS